MRCLSEKGTMEGVLKDEREKWEGSFETGPSAVWQTRGEKAEAGCWPRGCELCGYERRCARHAL